MNQARANGSAVASSTTGLPVRSKLYTRSVPSSDAVTLRLAPGKKAAAVTRSLYLRRTATSL